ncbi:basic proline-rich protein-like [Ursus arctos]|uniref:basic proline-rich protein-like n=1 Tax=Ursus arctos TaxID=9644 RepID=UPI002016ACC3|nr:basic proline-rich protein-like [Ursus arctos]
MPPAAASFATVARHVPGNSRGAAGERPVGDPLDPPPLQALHHVTSQAPGHVQGGSGAAGVRAPHWAGGRARGRAGRWRPERRRGRWRRRQQRRRRRRGRPRGPASASRGVRSLAPSARRGKRSAAPPTPARRRARGRPAPDAEAAAPSLRESERERGPPARTLPASLSRPPPPPPPPGASALPPAPPRRGPEGGWPSPGGRPLSPLDPRAPGAPSLKGTLSSRAARLLPTPALLTVVLRPLGNPARPPPVHPRPPPGPPGGPRP